MTIICIVDKKNQFLTKTFFFGKKFDFLPKFLLKSFQMKKKSTVDQNFFPLELKKGNRQKVTYVAYV